jgi:hypothetical protein
MVVHNPALAKEVLAEAGVPYTTAGCLALERPNNPAGFGGIAHTVAVAGINIEYLHASALERTPLALGVLGVSDLEPALALDWHS